MILCRAKETFPSNICQQTKNHDIYHISSEKLRCYVKGKFQIEKFSETLKLKDLKIRSAVIQEAIINSIISFHTLRKINKVQWSIHRT